jgi:hypothetical protein
LRRGDRRGRAQGGVEEIQTNINGREFEEDGVRRLEMPKRR